MGRQNNNPAFSGTLGGTVAAYTLAKRNSSNELVNSGANEQPIGIFTQDGVAADVIGVRSFFAGGENKIKANGSSVNIAIGDLLVAGASGKAIKLPAGAGTYFSVGQAQEACTVDGQIITVSPVGAGQRIVVT